ncbi:hypothetical protein [Rosettibacter firmus]|uniref:hypothetical protein n=1 Tax=Rosettibacter firmus TaxID=3111522 RepID=UPI00336C19BD
MKKLLFLMLIGVATLNAQFKDQNNSVDIRNGVIKNYSSSLFNFFKSENFKMNHTFDISYQTFGAAGSLALTTYTNSMFYRINDKLNIQADISLVNSPFNSFGKEFSNKINGLYLSRAQINYKPTENMSITFQYRNIPSYYYPYNYYSNFYYRDMFERFNYDNER